VFVLAFIKANSGGSEYSLGNLREGLGLSEGWPRLSRKGLNWLDSKFEEDLNDRKEFCIY